MAALGLSLSVYNTVQARRDKHPRLKVHLAFGFVGFGSELSKCKVLIDVGNAGNQSITLASLCIPVRS
jgi:hypothetical protein